MSMLALVASVTHRASTQEITQTVKNKPHTRVGLCKGVNYALLRTLIHYLL